MLLKSNSIRLKIVKVLTNKREENLILNINKSRLNFIKLSSILRKIRKC